VLGSFAIWETDDAELGQVAIAQWMRCSVIFAE
jgi:hypothetical protein